MGDHAQQHSVHCKPRTCLLATNCFVIGRISWPLRCANTCQVLPGTSNYDTEAFNMKGLPLFSIAQTEMTQLAATTAVDSRTTTTSSHDQLTDNHKEARTQCTIHAAHIALREGTMQKQAVLHLLVLLLRCPSSPDCPVKQNALGSIRSSVLQSAPGPPAI